MKTTSLHTIRIQNCIVKWSVKNIRDKVFERNGTDVSIPDGYYTFSSLKSFLEKSGVTITKGLDNKITLRADKDLNLKNCGVFLGFLKDSSISKNTDHESPHSADFLNGLQTIDVHCSLVDPMYNFEQSETHCGYSNLLVSLPIDTTQSLNGTFSTYDLKTKIPCKDTNHQEMSFILFSGGHEKDYEVFLDIEINV